MIYFLYDVDCIVFFTAVQPFLFFYFALAVVLPRYIGVSGLFSKVIGSFLLFFLYKMSVMHYIVHIKFALFFRSVSFILLSSALLPPLLTHCFIVTISVFFPLASTVFNVSALLCFVLLFPLASPPFKVQILRSLYCFFLSFPVLYILCNFMYLPQKVIGSFFFFLWRVNVIYFRVPACLFFLCLPRRCTRGLRDGQGREGETGRQGSVRSSISVRVMVLWC